MDSGKTVAVAVKKGKYSQLALKWAVENLAKDTQTLNLLHVRLKSDTFVKRSGRTYDKYRSIEAVCGEDVSYGIEQSYKETKELQVREFLSPLTSYCKKKKVKYEEVILEDDNTIHGIADFVLKNNIDVLVVGAGGSKGGLFGILRGPETASKIANSVPYFCTVYTIGKGGCVASVKSASTSTQNLSSLNSLKIQEPEIGNHVRSIDSIPEPRVTGLDESSIRSGPVSEFEFRSPLEKYGYSNFSWEGNAPSESDISYISSDKPFNGNAFSGYSTNSSKFSHGSFDSWQTSSSTSSSIMSSEASYSSQYSMDELRRLQLELLRTKKMYEAACNEELDAKQMSSKLKPLGLEDGHETYRMENDKDETAGKISNLKKRIVDHHAQQT